MIGRGFVENEATSRIEGVNSTYAAQKGDYLAVDFMKVPEGGGPDYVQMRQKPLKPIHWEIIRQGLHTAWHLVGLQFASANAPYQYMTKRPCDSWDDLFLSFF